MSEIQNYQNHVRYYPLFHFALFPLLSVNLIYQAVRLYQEPSWDRAMFVMLSVVLIAMIAAARSQALRAQDRIIRLEESLRYRDLVPDVATDALTLSQIIALRFASDAELPDLLRRVASGELRSSKEIKLAVGDWRADHLRV